MRKGAFLTLSVAVCILILIGTFARFNINRYHERIQSEMEQRLHRKVSLGEIKLRLLPPRLYIDQAVIGEDPEFARQAPFIRAQSMSASLGILPLLRRSIEIDAVDLQRPEVQVIKDERGRWNFSSLGVSKVESLTLRDGILNVNNLKEKQDHSVYDHVDFSIRKNAAGEPLSIDAALHVANRSDEELRLRGKLGPLSPVNILNTPFDGTLSLKKIPINGLNNILDTRLLGRPKGIASGKTTIKTSNGKVSAVGSIRIEDESFNDVSLGYPITIRFSLAQDPSTSVIQVSSATVDLRETSISINGSINTNTTPAQLDLKVRSSGDSVADLARLTSALGIGAGPDSTVTGQVASDLEIQGPVRTPTLNGTISAKNLRITSKGFPQPVEISSIDLAFTPSEIRSNEFQIRAGNTTAESHFDLTQYASKSPAINFTLRSTNAALMDVRSIGRAYGVKGFERISGSGTLSADLYARGSLASIKSSDVVKLLSGNATLNLSNVHVAGTDLSKALFPKSSQRVNIDRVTGHFILARGIATTHDLRVALNVGNVAAMGTVNLVNDTLNLRATAVLTKAASDQIIGSGPNQVLTAIGVNHRGELVVPGVITGTFDNPHFKPDEEQMALSRMKGILPTSENPAAMLGGLLGAQNQRKQPFGSVPSKLNPANEIENVFGHVLGGGKR